MEVLNYMSYLYFKYHSNQFQFCLSLIWFSCCLKLRYRDRMKFKCLNMMHEFLKMQGDLSLEINKCSFYL